MEINLDSKIDDLLKQDLPRTHILADIHNRIIKSLEKLKAPSTVNLHNIGLINGFTLSQFENFYNYWLGLAKENDFMQSKIFPLEITFAYSLLLPYYIDYTQVDFNKYPYINFDKNDSYRLIQSIDDNSFPHPYAVHHAHQIVNIFIERINHVSTTQFQAALKKGDKTKEHRRLFKGAFQKSLIDYPDISQKDRIDVVMNTLDEWLEKDNRLAGRIKEYDRDIIKKWISEYFNKKPHNITWFEIPSSQDEIILYIKNMPKLQLLC